VVFQEVKRIERCSIHMIDEPTGELQSVAARMLHTGDPYQSENYSRAIAEQSMREKRAMLVFDAMADGRFHHSASIDEQNIHSAICVPLETQEHIVGIIHADSSDTAAPLTEDDLRLLTAIGLQAGTAIENAQLYEHLNKEKNALEKANDQLQTTQNELLQSAKMAAVGQIASGVVHDIKTPMMVIMGYANLLREKLQQYEGLEAEEPGIFEYLNNIEEGVNHSNDVVNNLLKFARPNKPTKESVTANAIIEETLSFLKTEMAKVGIRVHVNLQNDPKILPVDGNQVKQVLINIIMNAIQAMQDTKGQLDLSTSDTRSGKHSMCCIEIKDNGCGMTEEQRSHMFEPFFTTKIPGEMGSGGTGLGLSVSYSIIKEHGGTMEVNSQVGKGTSFKIYLPCKAASPEETGPIEV
jgi:signal transduction histidine kinase